MRKVIFEKEWNDAKVVVVDFTSDSVENEPAYDVEFYVLGNFTFNGSGVFPIEKRKGNIVHEGDKKVTAKEKAIKYAEEQLQKWISGNRQYWE
jgi:hypothetical protein